MEQYIVKKEFNDNLNSSSIEHLDQAYIPVLNALLTYTTQDGYVLANTFLLQEKYEHEQFSLNAIKLKAETLGYSNLQSFSQDIHGFFFNIQNNCDVHSQIYKDGAKLLEVFVSELHRIQNNQKMRVIRNNELIQDKIYNKDEYEIIIELLNFVINYSDSSSNQQLSEPFQSLPSKHKYPEYYKIIAEPIDLNTITKKVHNKSYTSFTMLYNDLLLMCNNAKIFNEPGSWIYKIAHQLKKAITLKKVELEEKLTKGFKLNEKKMTRSSNTNSSLLTEEAYISDQDARRDGHNAWKTSNEEFSIFHDHGGAFKSDDDPYTHLFASIREFKNPKDGNYLSDPFLRLPSSHHYKDYYEEIARPIALTQIKLKIKKNLYTSIDELVDDLNLMFDNAIAYNIPGSQIHKSAAFLKDYLKIKVKELATIDFTVKRKCGSSYAASTPYKAHASRYYGETDEDSEYTYAQAQEKLFATFDDILEYKDDKDHIMAHHFLSKPNPVEYPNFYAVLLEKGSRALDLTDVERGLKDGKYTSLESLLGDLYKVFEDFKQLLFIPTSEGFKAAQKLQAILMDKLKAHTFVTKILKTRLVKIYEEFLNFEDVNKAIPRRISSPFIKLPSKLEYPDYYDVVKKPIDLTMIDARISAGRYGVPEDFFADLKLMLDNALKYNDPESVLYKDGLQLYKLLLERKTELCEEMLGKPDVQMRVQTILTSIYVSIVNYRNPAGRYLSDSIQDMAQVMTEKTTGLPTQYFQTHFSGRSMTLELIKKYLDGGYYKRLDTFQDHMLHCLKKALYLAKPGSQAVSDATDLIAIYFSTRDRYTGVGSILESCSACALNGNLPALKEQLARLGAMDSSSSSSEPSCFVQVEPSLTHTQQPIDVKTDTSLMDEEDCVTEETNSNSNDVNSSFGDFKRLTDNGASLEGYQVNGALYYPGDFVYLAPSEPGIPDPHIMSVQQFSKDPDTGELWVQGCWFYRPYETYHNSSRKFYEKEVFKSDFYDKLPANKVVGKCCVMFIRDYSKYRPMEFENKDIYVCEARYNTKLKSFKKMKMWNHISVCTANNPSWKDRMTFVARETPLQMVKAVPSMFLDKSFSEFVDDNTYVPPFPRPPQKDIIEPLGDVKGHGQNLIYYASAWWPRSDTFNRPAMNLKVGDYALVNLNNNGSNSGSNTIINNRYRQYVMRVESIYREDRGDGLAPLQARGSLCFLFHADTPDQEYPRNAKDVFLLPPNHPVPPEFPSPLGHVLAPPVEHVNQNSLVGAEIVKKVVVLGADTFSKRWPTEIGEVDIYVCRYQFTLPQGDVNDTNSGDEIQQRHQKQLLYRLNSIVPILYDNMYPEIGLRKLAAKGNIAEIGTTGIWDEWYHFDVAVSSSTLTNMQAQQRTVVSQEGHTSTLSDLLANDTAGTLDLGPKTQTDQNATRIEIMGSVGTPSLKEVFFGNAYGNSPSSAQSKTGLVKSTPGPNKSGWPTINQTPSPGSIMIDDDDFKYIQRKAKPSGYIVFSGERRKAVMDTYPELMFGDISKVIGNEWKKLGPAQKAVYEEKANRRAAELRSSVISLVSSQGVSLAPGASIDYDKLMTTLIAGGGGNEYPHAPLPSLGIESSPAQVNTHPRLSKRVLKLIRKSKALKKNGHGSAGQNSSGLLTRIYACGWNACTFQFEDENDLIDHFTAQRDHIQANAEGEYACGWNGCCRNGNKDHKERGKPFITHGRLIRHLKDAHFKQCVKYLYPDQFSKNFVRSSRKQGSLDDIDSNNSNSQLFFRMDQSQDASALIAESRSSNSQALMGDHNSQSRDRCYWRPDKPDFRGYRSLYQQNPSSQYGAPPNPTGMPSYQGGVVNPLAGQFTRFKLNGPGAGNKFINQNLPGNMSSRPFLQQPQGPSAQQTLLMAKQQALSGYDPSAPLQGQPQGSYLTNPKPLFVIPPPRVMQTVRHSDIYTKYIERLMCKVGGGNFKMDAPKDSLLERGDCQLDPGYLDWVKVYEPAKGLKRNPNQAAQDSEALKLAKIKALQYLKDQLFTDSLRLDNWLSAMPET